MFKLDSTLVSGHLVYKNVDPRHMEKAYACILRPGFISRLIGFPYRVSTLYAGLNNNFLSFGIFITFIPKDLSS